MNPTDLIVIGAGPAGLAAGIAAARNGARVTVLEQLDSPGRKLLATGGGRCNVNNILSVDEFASRFGRQWRFMLPALRGLTPERLRAYFARGGVPLEAADGFHFFPKSGRARDILDLLLRDLAEAGGKIQSGSQVRSLILTDGRLSGVRTDRGSLTAERVIVATGGRSHPVLGSSGTGYLLAAEAGHVLTAPCPALVGLVCAEEWVGRCAGLVLPDSEVRINLPGEKAGRGELLFTHRGVSGPAVLDLSGRVSELLCRLPEVPLAIRLNSGFGSEDYRQCFSDWRQADGRKQLSTLVGRLFPARLTAELLGNDGSRKAAELPAQLRDELAARLSALPLTISATEGWEKSMVTRGGVTLREISPDTLESRRLPGLYFAGEVLDLDGPCGGYNLQWAFSSGLLAGHSASGGAAGGLSAFS